MPDEPYFNSSQAVNSIQRSAVSTQPVSS